MLQRMTGSAHLIRPADAPPVPHRTAPHRSESQRIDPRANALLHDKKIYNRRDASQA
ncbi:hypothetical protein [Burkholderia sp. Se-20378]|uniref:hypothetical protein n=1 Tax=Burkholderia sp. Se-20378 TaxID=2703899 RepID=UPI00197F8825|nr:hypothetical protein [Burkholderia sp. Se-20378]